MNGRQWVFAWLSVMLMELGAGILLVYALVVLPWSGVWLVLLVLHGAAMCQAASMARLES